MPKKGDPSSFQQPEPYDLEQRNLPPGEYNTTYKDEYIPKEGEKPTHYENEPYKRTPAKFADDTEYKHLTSGPKGSPTV